MANQRLCREHYRLAFRTERFPDVAPGQFVHLGADSGPRTACVCSNGDLSESGHPGPDALTVPLLRRAFSVAGVTREDETALVDVIYRVVGTATRWMETLRSGDRLSVLGPLGNGFPIHDDKSVAWLVAGGVGLPPMLWLASRLQQVGQAAIAFCGARTADLLPLTVEGGVEALRDARRATDTCREFSEVGAKVVLSTDDGTLGYAGHVGAAMQTYHEANPIAADDVVVYTCGPQRMIQFVAAFCEARGIECYACLERAMACGTGLCQSCVVAVQDGTDAEGWSYRLCCTDGPVFRANDVVW